MSLALNGKLLSKLAQQTGQGKNGTWVKQEFIIETQEQYPKKVCISAWGDKVKEFDGIAVGDTLMISVNIESREFNGRWYTDVRVWRVERLQANNNVAPDLSPFPDDYQLPSSDTADDLPF